MVIDSSFVLLAMIFLHIIDDYCLQGILASMKQEAWWKAQKQYKELYKYDYIVALMMHSFSWTFMIMLPIAIITNFNATVYFAGFFAGNFVIHAFVDDLKANQLKINLVIDQTIHILQIVITYFFFVYKILP